MSAPALPAKGDIVARAEFQVTRDSLVRYAGASGDFNPIHYRDDIATSVGLPSVLAHGMLTMGLAVQPVVAWLGGSDRVTDYQVRFTKPVPVPPEGAVTLTVEAKAAEVDAETATARIDLAVRLGEATVLGRAQVRVRLGER